MALTIYNFPLAMHYRFAISHGVANNYKSVIANPLPFVNRHLLSAFTGGKS